MRSAKLVLGPIVRDCIFIEIIDALTAHGAETVSPIDRLSTQHTALSRPWLVRRCVQFAESGASYVCVRQSI